MWLGTPAYMSPEQWKSQPDIDGRSDLYSLGVILFECLSGHLPYAGNTPYEWLSAHLTHPVPPLPAPEAAPLDLVQCVGQLLSKEREERPRTAGEVAETLQRCLASTGRPQSLTVVTPPVALPAAPEGAVHASTLRSGAGQISVARRERAQGSRAIAAIVALAAMSGALWLHHRWALEGGQGPDTSGEFELLADGALRHRSREEGPEGKRRPWKVELLRWSEAKFSFVAEGGKRR